MIDLMVWYHFVSFTNLLHSQIEDESQNDEFNVV